MRPLLLLTVALLSGCAAAPDADTESLAAPSGPGEPCLETHGAKATARIEMGDRYVWTDAGFSMVGRQYHFPWAGEEERLREVNVTATWDTPPLGQETLRIEIDDADDSNFEFQTPYAFDGPSPLSGVVAANGTSAFGAGLRVMLRVGWEGHPGANVALRNQDVTLTVLQTYEC